MLRSYRQHFVRQVKRKWTCPPSFVRHLDVERDWYQSHKLTDGGRTGTRGTARGPPTCWVGTTQVPARPSSACWLAPCCPAQAWLLTTQKRSGGQAGGGKACFILDARLDGEGGCLSRELLPTTDNQWARAFRGWGRGCVQRRHSQLQQSSRGWPSMVRPASSWLFYVQSGFSSMVGLFPFPWGQSSEL